MTIVAAFEAVALVAIVCLFLRERASERSETARERSELLNRIQRPEFIPVAQQPAYEYPEDEEPDELGMVGQILDVKPVEA